MPADRDATGRFVKGKSGNPQGRRKMPEKVRQMLFDASYDATKLLIDTMHDKDAKPELRIRCAETVLERVYGKAIQPIDGVVDNRIEIVMGGAARYAD